MNNALTGGCSCGAIRYQTQSEAEFTIICQCRQCQRITGSGHAASFAVMAAATSINGTIQYYETTADDGNTTSSGFCGNCGNPVLKKTNSYPQFVFFHAATLDQPQRFRPQMLVYTESAQPWDFVDPNLPRQ